MRNRRQKTERLKVKWTKKTHGHVLQFKFIVKMLMFVSIYFCQNIPKGKLVNTKQGKRVDALNGTD